MGIESRHNLTAIIVVLGGVAVYSSVLNNSLVMMGLVLYVVDTASQLNSFFVEK